MGDILLLLSLLLLFGNAQAQQREAVYAFINEKLETDSLLGMKFFPKRIHIYETDTAVCSIVTDMLERESTFLLMEQLSDSTLSDEEFVAVIMDTTIKSSTELQYGYLKNQCVIDQQSIQLQLKNNNNRKWHQQKYLIKDQRLVRHINRKTYSYFKLSNPIFFNNGAAAVIYLNIYYGPMYSRGYIELYLKNKTTGRWEYISSFLRWMS